MTREFLITGTFFTGAQAPPTRLFAEDVMHAFEVYNESWYKLSRFARLEIFEIMGADETFKEPEEE